jgi:ectoine hydroxylase-related dioxygenase (phytanoyl-CoA dioxygenase family)
MDVHGRRFREEGSFVVERALAADDLAALQRECQRLVEEREAEMDRLGCDVLDLDHRGRRYFLHGYDTSAALRRFLSSDLMVRIARVALGDTVHLFNEQFVVKAADRGLRFSWHQDSGFIRYPHEPYLTCWIPLDDVDAENGTVWLLPYSRAGTCAVVEHVVDPETNDLIGYFGDDPGDPLVLPAGSIACFSSTVFHRSGPNTTGRMRRAFVAQHSAQPILDEDGSGPRHLAVPLTTLPPGADEPRGPMTLGAPNRQM